MKPFLSVPALALVARAVSPPFLAAGRVCLQLVQRNSWLGWCEPLLRRPAGAAPRALTHPPPRWACGFAVAKYGAVKHRRRRLRTELTHVLADISGPDLQRLLGSLPAWVQYPDYERVAWLNAVIRQAWPYIDKAVEGVLRDNLNWLFERPPVNLRLFGLQVEAPAPPPAAVLHAVAWLVDHSIPLLPSPSLSTLT